MTKQEQELIRAVEATDALLVQVAPFVPAGLSKLLDTQYQANEKLLKEIRLQESN
jgi:hypothetical protein